ncbi:MAG: ligand-binding sensor domain-containing protein [Crocinitomix sp.]
MKFILVALAALFSLFSFAQQYDVKSYTVEDGLAISQVKDICQDEHGYLWIGTTSGLSRYDGVEFKNYFIDDGLLDNLVRTIYISEKGKLWIATADGVTIFDQQKFTSYKFNEPYTITDIFELQGEMYFGTYEGLVQLKNGIFIQVGQEESYEYNIRSGVNYKDSIIICGTKKGLYTWDGDEFEHLLIPGYEEIYIRSVDVRNDILYVTCVEVGLFSYNLSTKEIISYNLNHNYASDVVFSENSIFGISKYRGAFLINNKDTLYFDDSNGLMGPGLECVFKDKEGNIWMGTDGSGLLRFSGTSIVSYTTKEGLGSDKVMSVTQDTSGGFIFGTFDNGVTLFRSNGIEYIRNRGGVIFHNTVWSTFQDSLNRTWLGTSRGLAILDENNKSVAHPLLGIETQPKIRTMVLAGDRKTMLLAGNTGLIVMTEDSVYMRHLELNINKLYVLNGTVYCGTRGTGLYKLDESDNFESLEQFKLPEATINALTSDFQNNLWIGTENGLYVMQENQNIFRFNLFERNDRSKNILSLITAKDGSVWAAGMQGVYQVAYDGEAKRGYTVKNYGTPEGLIDEETNTNSLYEDYKGNIWVGTPRGLAKIDPAASESLFKYELPMLHITGMRLFMDEFNYSDYTHVLDSVFNVPTSIELPHNKNHLTFDFIGINLKNPNAVQYEYRLIGVNDMWSPVRRSNSANYSFLQPGDYTFQVRAMNKSRDWSEIQELSFVIHPPFWKSWWFISLMVLLGFLIIIYVFQSRIGVLKQKQDNEQLELKNRLLFLEQRSLNASMNRHFIFNSLNSIQYFINSSNKRSANKFLSNFAKLIRMNLDSSAANNFIVTLQEEIERIELYLGLEKMRFSDKFEFTIDVSSALDTESIEIPSMILQPFVENSIIHGVLSLERKGQIEVKVYQEFGEVVFEVVDNGLGIDNSLALKTEQIAGDHESKGVEITNRRIEILRRLTGENLLIIGPFQMNGDNDECFGTKVIIKLGGAEKFQE